MSLQSGNPTGYEPRDSQTPVQVLPQILGQMEVDSQTKKEPEDCTDSQSRRRVGAAIADVQNSTEEFSIASPRGTDSRKSSRSSRSSRDGGTERERSPRLVAAHSHRGPGALCASPLADDPFKDRTPQASPRSIAPHDSSSAHSSGLASGSNPGPAQPEPGTIQFMQMQVWQGPLPDKFVSKEEVMYWEQQVHSRVQVLMEEKQEQMKAEANCLMENFEQRAELYKDEARKLVFQGENKVKKECEKEFRQNMADMSSQLSLAQQDAARLRGVAQSRADSNLQLANQAEAASSEAASARQHLEKAVSMNQKQAQRTASMEFNAEQFIHDLQLCHRQEKEEYDQAIALKVQEMSQTQFENQALRKELAARMSELAANSPNDAV